MIGRLLPAALLCLLAFVLTGCLDTDQTYVINPDGSGKVTVEARVQQLDLGKLTKKSPKVAIANFLNDVVEKSSGVAAWKDVTCKLQPDGRIYFKGTAYFDDITTLEIKEVVMSRLRVVRSGETMTIAYGNPTDTAEQSEPPVTLSEEDIQHRADSLKQNYAMAMSMIGTMLKTMKERATVTVGGRITSAEGFTRNGESDATIFFSGQRAMSMMDSLSETKNFFRDQVVAEAAGAKAEKDREMRKMMFGVEQPNLVVRTGGAALFNYAQEASAARKGYAALLKKFGAKPAVSATE